LDTIGSIMKFLGAFLGVKPAPAPVPRGFLGAELADADGGAVVRAVLPGGPAAKAGLKPGDRVTKLGRTDLSSSRAFLKALGMLKENDLLTLTVERGGKPSEIVVTLGGGL
jgi:putative serine protease PepD